MTPKSLSARAAPPGQALTDLGNAPPATAGRKPATCAANSWVHRARNHHDSSAPPPSSVSLREHPPSAPAALWPEPHSLQVLNGAGSRVGLQTELPPPSSATALPTAFSREFGRRSLFRLLPVVYWAKYLLGALHGDIQGVCSHLQSKKKTQ